MTASKDIIINLGNSKRLGIKHNFLFYENDIIDFKKSFSIQQIRKLTFIPFNQKRNLLSNIWNAFLFSNDFDLYGNEGVEKIQQNVMRIDYKPDDKVRWETIEIKSDQITFKVVEQLKHELKKENKKLR
jgi:hypothetical protein